MKCPVCGEELRRVGIERVVNGKVVAEFECPRCRYRSQGSPGFP